MTDDRYLIGLDVGSATVKAVVQPAGESADTILWSHYERHETRQQDKCLELLLAIERAFPGVPHDAFRIFVTGSGGNAVAEAIGGCFVQEVHAVSLAVARRYPEVQSVIELGGEDAKMLIFQTDPNTGVQRKYTSMNDKCAGGTGAVIDKVAAKLGISPPQLASMPYAGVRIHSVAGKCGVFAETDINGLQRQGTPPEELIASLFEAIVIQNFTVLARGHTLRPPVLLLGGPNTFLQGMRECWRHHLATLWRERGIEVSEPIEKLVFVPDNALLFGALGAVAYGQGELNRHDAIPDRLGIYLGAERLRDSIQQMRIGARAHGIPALVKDDAETEMFKQRYAPPIWKPPVIESGSTVDAFIGLDGGSTSTKAVLLDREQRVLAKAYRLSRGNPIEDAQDVLADLEQHIVQQGATLRICGVATTGYAKDLLHDVIGADLALVETVAHMRSGLLYAPDADVICDVGGQDIKVILLRNGVVKDFRLNTQCSAGNGHYLQATAAAFGYPVEAYADIAFEARTMPEFGYGCAVFLQSDIVDFQRQGWRPNEILAGLAAVLPKNVWLYVCQMPNVSQLGTHFVLQGGTQRNLAAVKAQVDFLEARFADTGKTPRIQVHPHCAEAGAIGCALEVLRRYNESPSSSATRFVGFDVIRTIQHHARRDEGTRCMICSNRCLRTFIDLSARKPDGEAWTHTLVVANCERGTAASAAEAQAAAREVTARKNATPNLLATAAQKLFEPVMVNLIASKSAPWHVWSQTRRTHARQHVQIGMPRALNLYGAAPFFMGFFQSLGIPPEHLVWSDYTTEALYREGARRGSIDPCYPSKLAAAHLHNLLRRHAEGDVSLTHIFFPIVDGFPTWLTNLQASRSCPSSMAAVEAACCSLQKESDLFAEQGIALLKPFCNLDDQEACAMHLYEAWRGVLRLTKQETLHAVEEGYRALETYFVTQRRVGRDLLERLERKGDVGLVILGRPYHADPGINHGIGDAFQQLGYPVFTHDSLPLDDDILRKVFKEDIGAESGLLESGLAHARSIDDVWKNSFAENSSRKLWAAKFVARHPNLVALELSNFKCGHDAPVFATLEAIIEASGKPFFYFRDIDENRPAASIRIRVETIVHFLERYRETLRTGYRTL